MKKLLFLTLISAIIVSCSNIETPNDSRSELIHHSPVATTINKSDALKIANKVLKRGTHNLETKAMQPCFEFVMQKSTTRSESSLPDTLAYVINYPNEEGFVIVSADSRVNPVLAFSETGSFNFSNEIARTQFIDNIQDYIEQHENAPAAFDVLNNELNYNGMVDPIIRITIGQGSPWNQVVSQHHPNCLVGCVAVASALVMTHAKDSLSYHNDLYRFNEIVDAIERGNDFPLHGLNNLNLNFDPGPIQHRLPTYQEAVYYMSNILYLVGTDIGTVYGTNSSSAYYVYAYNLINSLGYTTSSYTNYNLNDVTQYLRNGYIIFMHGCQTGQTVGHAWVGDGCIYLTSEEDNNIIIESYIHCDWGWNGSCNGYFSGSVFSPNANRSYNLQKYFAVQLENININ